MTLLRRFALFCRPKVGPTQNSTHRKGAATLGDEAGKHLRPASHWRWLAAGRGFVAAAILGAISVQAGKPHSTTEPPPHVVTVTNYVTRTNYVTVSVSETVYQTNLVECPLPGMTIRDYQFETGRRYMVQVSLPDARWRNYASLRFCTNVPWRVAVPDYLNWRVKEAGTKAELPFTAPNCKRVDIIAIPAPGHVCVLRRVTPINPRSRD